MNKTLTVLVVIIVVILGLLVITKPSDQSCIDQVKDHISAQIANSNQNKIVKAIEEVATDLAGQYGLRIEDHVIYKSIYVKGGDTPLATGILGLSLAGLFGIDPYEILGISKKSVNFRKKYIFEDDEVGDSVN